EDSVLPFFSQMAPIDAIQLGIVELLLTRVHDLWNIDGSWSLGREFIDRPNPQSDWRLRRLSPTMIKPAQRRGEEASCPYFRIISSFACCNARPLSTPAANLV